MLLIDYSSLCISTLLATLGPHTNIDIEEGMIRHMVLNTLRSAKSKFRDYGEVVIACDHRRNWRRDAFPYYKHSRRESRKKDELKWNVIFKSMDLIRDELKENFPYRVMYVDGAEADDIIYVMVKNTRNPVLILSGDKDFCQLHKYSNVRQYDFVRKREIRVDDPENFLFEHIVRGDASDGIPNIFMPEDFFVTGSGRQKMVTKKRLDEVRRRLEENDLGDLERRFVINRRLIDLSRLPEDLEKRILEEYEKESKKKHKPIFNYLMKHNLSKLIEDIGDFV